MVVLQGRVPIDPSTEAQPQRATQLAASFTATGEAGGEAGPQPLAEAFGSRIARHAHEPGAMPDRMPQGSRTGQ
ncbi:MAG: hypothetical protein EBZ51_13030, partial [Synechococcaceae bacterium WB9_2_112]|nr:hypothetical protein [Synechococcaceae bacterium WB9_2_112]